MRFLKELEEAASQPITSTTEETDSQSAIDNALETGEWNDEAIDEITDLTQEYYEQDNRFARELERGMSAESRESEAYAGASIIARRSSETSRANRQLRGPFFDFTRRAEERKQIRRSLIPWAKEMGFWFNDYEDEKTGKPFKTLEQFLENEYGKPAAIKSESIVYFSKDMKYVVKAMSAVASDGDFKQLLEKIELHNQIFPETAYELLGFGMTQDGELRCIVKQPFIEGEPVPAEMAEKFLVEHLKAKPTDEPFAHTIFDGKVQIKDITDPNNRGNILLGTDGHLYVIDADLKFTEEEAMENTGETITSQSTTPDQIQFLTEEEPFNTEIDGIRNQAIKDGKIILKKDGSFDYALAPNGEKSNLNEIQWLQVRTKAFKNWFGDWENDPTNASKVVDKNGEPLVVYHYTDSNFDTFDLSKTGTNWKQSFKYGKDVAYFLSYPKAEDEFLGDMEIPVFLSIKNPGQSYMYTIENENYPITDDVDGLMPLRDTESEEHEGSNGFEYGEFVIFNPNQVKSATGNNGEFSTNNDNIYFQKSLPEEIKKLKSLSKPLKNFGSIDKQIRKIKSTGVDQSIVTLINKALKLNPSLSNFSAYEIFTIITQAHEDDFASKYNEGIQQEIDKALEKHLTDYLKKYNIDIIVNEEFTKEHGVAGAYVVLNKIIYLAKEGERNALTLPEEFAHAFVELMGSKYFKNTDKHPEGKDFNYLYDNITQLSIYQQVYEQYKDVYKNKDGSPNIYKIRKEAIGQALAVAIKSNWEGKDEQEKSFFTRLKEWFQKILNIFKDVEYVNVETLLNTIAREIVQGKTTRLNKVNSEGYNLLDYDETIENQNKQDGGKAVNFMRDFCEMGNIITGSLSYRYQGTVYRSKIDSLHDIDMEIPKSAHNIDFSIPELQTEDQAKILEVLLDTPYFKKIKQKYPKIKFGAAYLDKSKTFYTVNACYSENEELSEKFLRLNGSYAKRLDNFTEEERKQIYLFDFFLHEEDEIDYIYDDKYKIKLTTWDKSFKAKQFWMGRAKDIFDYQMWKAYDEFKNSYKSPLEEIMFQQSHEENPVLTQFKQNIESLSGYYEGGGALLTNVIPNLPKELDDKLDRHFMEGNELTIDDYRELWKYIMFVPNPDKNDKSFPFIAKPREIQPTTQPRPQQPTATTTTIEYRKKGTESPIEYEVSINENYDYDSLVIKNKHGKEVYKTDSKDRRKIYSKLLNNKHKTVVVEHKGHQYVVLTGGRIMSLQESSLGDFMKWDENNGDRKEIIAKAREAYLKQHPQQQTPQQSPQQQKTTQQPASTLQPIVQQAATQAAASTEPTEPAKRVVNDPYMKMKTSFSPIQLEHRKAYMAKLFHDST